MDQEKIKRLTRELVGIVRQPENLYGSRRWGCVSYIKGDVEIEFASSRSEHRSYSIIHPEFLVDHVIPNDHNPNMWPRDLRVTEQFCFEGDLEAFEREMIWLRLSA